MKKRHLSILLIIPILAVIIIFYYLTLPSPFIPFSNLEESQIQENRTPVSSSSSLPEQTGETPTTGGGAEGGGEGEETGEGGEGGGGSGPPSNYTPKINYTLNIDSFPSGLEVLTNYSIDNVILNIRDISPYSVEIESDTVACVLLTTKVTGGIIRWELDSEDCEPSICVGFIGCRILMDKPHTAFVYYTRET